MVTSATDAFAISCAMRSTWTFHAIFIRSVEAHLNVSDVARHHCRCFSFCRRAPATDVESREVVFNCSFSLSVVYHLKVYACANRKTWVRRFGYRPTDGRDVTVDRNALDIDCDFCLRKIVDEGCLTRIAAASVIEGAEAESYISAVTGAVC